MLISGPSYIHSSCPAWRPSLRQPCGLEEEVLLLVSDIEVKGKELHGGDAHLVFLAIRPDPIPFWYMRSIGQPMLISTKSQSSFSSQS